METRSAASGSLEPEADQTATDRIGIAAGIQLAVVAYTAGAFEASGASSHSAVVAGSRRNQLVAAGTAGIAAASEALAGFDQEEQLAGSHFALAVVRQCTEDEEAEARRQTVEG